MTQPSIDPCLGCRGSTSFPGLNSIFSAVYSCVHSEFMGVLLLVGIFFCDLFPAFCYISGHAGVSFKGFFLSNWVVNLILKTPFGKSFPSTYSQSVA